jgi:DNA-binding XRE family transcriptional regulator
MTGHELRVWRIRQSLSQEELSQQLGVRQSSISMWENSEHIPKLAARLIGLLDEVAALRKIHMGKRLKKLAQSQRSPHEHLSP